MSSITKINKPLDPKDFDESKIAFSCVKTYTYGPKHQYVNVTYNEDRFVSIARNCEVKSVTDFRSNLKIILFKITDENFIKMINSYDILLKFTGYMKSKSWFNNNELTSDTINTMLKPTVPEHSSYGHHIVCYTSINYVNSDKFSKDCLLIEKDKIIDVCFSFDQVKFHPTKFYSINVIEKIQKIKYIGPWYMRMHNETSKKFQNLIMTILLCNNNMKVPLCYDMIISVCEHLQTF